MTIDCIPQVPTYRMFDHLTGYDLLNLFRVSRKWRDWVFDYAPGRLRRSSPAEYTEDISSERALSCLVSHSIHSYNIAKGSFRHIVLPLYSFRSGSVSVPGVGRPGVVVSTSDGHGKGHHVICTRTGAATRVFLGETFFEWRVQNLLWKQIENTLHGWDPSTGALRHTIVIPHGQVCDLKEHILGGMIATFLRVNDTYQLAILDLKNNRVRILCPPEPDFTAAHGGYNHPDFCPGQNGSVSVIWHRNDLYRLANYSLASDEENLLPTEVRSWNRPVAVIHDRIECGDLQLAQQRGRWFILNSQGDEVYRRPIVNLCPMDECIVLCVEEHYSYSFLAFDPKKREVIWTCPLPLETPLDAFNGSIMKAASKERIFLYGGGTYLLLDLKSRSIVKSYQFTDVSRHSYLHFDGEKIVDGQRGNKLHILDFGYQTEAPRQTLEFYISRQLRRAQLPQPGQSYQLQPFQIVPGGPTRTNDRRDMCLLITMVAFLAASFFLARHLLQDEDPPLHLPFAQLRI